MIHWPRLPNLRKLFHGTDWAAWFFLVVGFAAGLGLLWLSL